jgi:DNA-binding NtrC family response regulator
VICLSGSGGAPGRDLQPAREAGGRETVVATRNLNGRLLEIVDELVDQGLTLEQARQEFERQFITASLRSHDWNFCRSARSLGVHRNTLRNKLSSLGLTETSARAKRAPRR